MASDGALTGYGAVFGGSNGCWTLKKNINKITKKLKFAPASELALIWL
ncbi:MAG: hypothetical protein JO154_13805 [Chitinophaga sp.]|nr:hypothetical protein [Chitinophaga sp.]